MLWVVVRMIEDLEDELGWEVEGLEEGARLANVGVGGGCEGGGGLRGRLEPAEEAANAR